YGTASNWNQGFVPTQDNPNLNDFWNVTINRGAGATVTGNSNAEILNLTIGALNRLNLSNGNFLSLDGSAAFGPCTVSNAGTIQLGTTTGAQLNLDGSSTNLSGGGTIVMTGAANIGGAGTLTSDNTVRGSGNLGSNSLAIINNGTVLADVSGGSLAIDPRS